MINNAFLARRLIAGCVKAMPRAAFVALMLVVTPSPSVQPASAQSFGEALRNMRRDFSDLFGTPEERRRMLRRGDARRAGRPAPGDEGYGGGYFDPLSSAPTPRIKPTPDEVAANEAARRARGVYNDPEYDVGAAPVSPQTGASAAESGGGLRQGRSEPRRKQYEDPLDALLGPENDQSQDQGAVNDPTDVVLAEEPGATDVAPPRTNLAQTAALSRSIAPAPTSAPAQSRDSLLAQPAVQITLAFLVGLGLLGLAVLREWRGRKPGA